VSVAVPGTTHVFSYWHIVPVVSDAQPVGLHQLLGRVAPGWGHVHFAESEGGVHLNPLREGGLGPYADRTAPSVAAVTLHGTDLVAAVFDTPDPQVPGAWANEPVTPALVRWRVVGGGWRTVMDSRRTMLPNARFGEVYTPAARQNHEGRPGLFSVYLDRTWCAQGTRSVSVEVEVADTAGNRTVVAVALPGRTQS
jgi:hypothetical protein